MCSLRVEDRRFELLTLCLQSKCSTNWANPPYFIWAIEGIQTLDPLLGREMLYRLSYYRNFVNLSAFLLSSLHEVHKGQGLMWRLNPPTCHSCPCQKNQRLCSINFTDTITTADAGEAGFEPATNWLGLLMRFELTYSWFPVRLLYGT